MLIGATSAPALAGGPRMETMDIGIKVDMLSKKSAYRKEYREEYVERYYE